MNVSFMIIRPKLKIIIRIPQDSSVLWLRLCFQCRERGFKAWLGTNIPHAMWLKKKKKKKDPNWKLKGLS